MAAPIQHSAHQRVFLETSDWPLINVSADTYPTSCIGFSGLWKSCKVLFLSPVSRSDSVYIVRMDLLSKKVLFLHRHLSEQDGNLRSVARSFTSLTASCFPSNHSLQKHKGTAFMSWPHVRYTFSCTEHTGGDFSSQWLSMRLGFLNVFSAFEIVPWDIQLTSRQSVQVQLHSSPIP